jgi:hypothetical protein
MLVAGSELFSQVLAARVGVPPVISIAYYVCCFSDTADVGFLHQGLGDVWKQLGIPKQLLHERMDKGYLTGVLKTPKSTTNHKPGTASV